MSGTEAPRGQKLPASHGLQLSAPESFCQVPPSHGAHSPIPSSGAMLPGRHAFGWRAPPGHSSPLAHAVQLWLPVKLPALNVPGLQSAGSGKLLPRGQVKPVGQSLQLVAPSAAWYFPSSQLVHSGLRSPSA